MIKIVFLTLLFCSQFGVAHAQSQMQMNEEAQQRYEVADQELNAVYGKVAAAHKVDALFSEKLKKAQRAWIAYRDAMLELRYPVATHGDANLEYGSAYPLCVAEALSEITKQQTNVLAAWVTTGPDDGDACAGSTRPQ